MIESIIENELVEHIWPVYVDERLFPGSRFTVNGQCTNKCRKGDGDNYICEHGLSYITRKISGRLIQVSGVFISTNITSKKYKKMQF